MQPDDKKLEKLLNFSDDPGLAIFDELQEINDNIEDIRGLNLADIGVLQGEPGYTPEKGKDYFTDEEVSKLKKEVTPIKGKDYFDGKDARNPIHIGNVAPINPKKGDLWYKD